MQPVFSIDGGHPSAAAPVLAVLGMGGTIAGRAASPHDVVGYQAGVVPVADLVAGMAPPVGWRVQAQQVANVDSKDMTVALWQALLGAVHAQLQQPEVGAIVVTHGTDTLEETAWLLQTVLQPARNRKSTRLNSSHIQKSRMPSSA